MIPSAASLSRLAQMALLGLLLGGCPTKRPPKSQFPTGADVLDRMKATFACANGVQGHGKLDHFSKKGRIRGEKDVDQAEWFFKAHFFQDPVQPGSLGIEAMVQILQLFMLETGMDEGIDSPRFEPMELGRPMTWKYRGQVVPSNKVISTTMDIVDTGTDERGTWAVADTSLWVDGKRIYEASNLGMRIVSGAMSTMQSASRRS